MMLYDEFTCFSVTVSSRIAYVVIEHPPINLLDEVLAKEFDALARKLEVDDAVRVVILRSANPDFFIAHSGVARVTAASKEPSGLRSFRLTQLIGERFRSMPKVVIAQVEGRARGGGNEIAMAADMCFAAIGRATFGQPEVAVGMVPGGGATQRLPRLVGRGRALEVLLGCGDFTAQAAEQYGWINRALPPDEIGPFVEDLAARIGSFPAHAVVHAKAAVDQGAFHSLSEGLLVEAHQSDLCVANDLTRQRVADALQAGLETYQGELDVPALVASLPPMAE